MRSRPQALAVTRSRHRWFRSLAFTGAVLVLTPSGVVEAARQIHRHEHAADPHALEAAEVPQFGWRRTSRGWEEVETWPVTNSPPRRSIDDWIAVQVAAEPAWLQTTFATIRRIPPLTFALLQVVAIGVIAGLGSRRRD